MNVLILVNGAPYHRPFFARVGEALERAGHKAFYAVDSHSTEFMHPAAALPAERTSVFSDFFEANYEKCPLTSEFVRLNLWTALFPDLDRAEYSSTMLRRREGYYERLAENLVAYFADLIARHRIDAIVYESVSNAFAYVAYLVAKTRGVRYVGFGMSRLPGRIDVTDQAYYRHSRTERLFKGILAGTTEVPEAARTAAAEYLTNLDKKRPDYVTVNGFMTWSPFRRYARVDALTNYLRALRFYLSSPRRHEFAYQLSNPLVVYPEHFARETVRWARSLVLKRRYVEPADLSKPFFVYPLQYHPESSCAVDGAYFNDDLVNVLNTAMNLPPGHLLYVKDHPYAFAQAPMSLYRRIRRVPNVRLIDWTIDSKHLIRHARAVVTSTSSFGFEAILLGKPVFVLGHPFYDFHPLARRVRSWDEAFDQFVDYDKVRARPEEIRAFVEAYFLSSRAGSYDLKSNVDNPDAIDLIAKIIVDEAAPPPRSEAVRHA